MTDSEMTLLAERWENLDQVNDKKKKTLWIEFKNNLFSYLIFQMDC